MHIKVFHIWFIIGAFSINSDGQAIEIMGGDKGMFFDIQWFKPLRPSTKWTVFSRTRATVSYENKSDVFTGAYLNWTSKSGLGGSAIGRVGSNGGGMDMGIHFFKSSKKWMIFALSSIAIQSKLAYSWFSIIRFTPSISNKKKLFSSLESYALFRSHQHVVGVQRLRMGIDHGSFQYGIGNNLTLVGSEWLSKNNFGVFVRKNF